MIRSYTSQPSLIVPFPFISQITRRIRIVHAGMWLLFTISLWLAMEATAPQIVRAYTARVDLSIDRLPDPNESYETILQRAKAVARAAAQRSFDQDILVTDVSIIVAVQSCGAIVPVLELKASRPQWRKQPDVNNWATYFGTAQSLLYFEKDSKICVAPPLTPTRATVTNPNLNESSSDSDERTSRDD